MFYSICHSLCPSGIRSRSVKCSRTCWWGWGSDPRSGPAVGQQGTLMLSRCGRSTLILPRYPDLQLKNTSPPSPPHPICWLLKIPMLTFPVLILELWGVKWKRDQTEPGSHGNYWLLPFGHTEYLHFFISMRGHHAMSGNTNSICECDPGFY